MLENNEIILLLILVIVTATHFVIPKCKEWWEKNKKTEKLENFESNVTKDESKNNKLLENGMPSIDSNKCSPECCKQTQWPVPHDNGPKASAEYIGSNLTCTHGAGSGCLCVSKDDFNYLASRGNNTSSKVDNSAPLKCN
jgi:hypothetical protein